MSSFMDALQQASVADLLQEFKRRGITVEIVKGAADAAGVDASAGGRTQTVFETLDAIEKWCRNDRHRGDRDRVFTEYWSEVSAFDWVSKPKGFCVDANKSVKIGIGEYSKYEDREQAQILLIQHFDSAQPGNYAKRDSWNRVPPVWAIAMSVDEMKELTASVVANAASHGTLIHREPQGDMEPDAPWWQESHWLIENGKITGVRISVKCTQDKDPNTILVRFKLRGQQFDKTGVEVFSNIPKISAGSFVLPEVEPAVIPPLSFKIPAPPVQVDFAVGDRVQGNYNSGGTWYPGVITNMRANEVVYNVDYDDGSKEEGHPRDWIECEGEPEVGKKVQSKWKGGSLYPGTISAVAVSETNYDIHYDDNSNETKVVKRNIKPASGNDSVAFEDSGSSALTMRASEGKSSTTNYEIDHEDKLCQSLRSPNITVTNPTDSRIGIKEFWVELQNESGEWVRGKTRVGQSYNDYYGRKTVDFVDVQSFAVQAHASLDIVLEGTATLPRLGRKPFNGSPHNSRIHPAFPDPFVARINLRDDADQIRQLCYQYSNPDMEEVWWTYDEAVASRDPSDGFGPNFQADMWLCVENPLTLNKCIILVSTAKENPTEWYVRCQSDSRTIGGSYNCAGAEHFRKMAFNCLTAKGPLEVDVELGGDDNIKLTGLVDEASGVMYALHGKITIKDGDKILASSEAYMPMDYARVVKTA